MTEESDKCIEALAKHLGCTYDEIRPTGCDYHYQFGSEEYLVLTDLEATERIAEDIRNETLCYFNASFICQYTNLPENIIELIQKYANADDAQEAFLSLVGDKFDDLVEEAISADGRGHYLSGYDGSEEGVVVDKVSYFIYRI